MRTAFSMRVSVCVVGRVTRRVRSSPVATAVPAAAERASHVASDSTTRHALSAVVREPPYSMNDAFIPPSLSHLSAADAATRAYDPSGGIRRAR